jgi:import receptor subunit TOM20
LASKHTEQTLFLLGKEKKRVDKAVASQASLAAASSSALSKDALRDALAQVKQEDIPPSPEQKEAYFMQQVAIGEQLSAQGAPMSTSFPF